MSTWVTLYYLALFYAIDPDHHLVSKFMENWQQFLSKDTEEFKSVIRLFNVSFSESPELANLLFQCTEVTDQLMNDPFDTHPSQRENFPGIFCDFSWKFLRILINLCFYAIVSKLQNIVIFAPSIQKILVVVWHLHKDMENLKRLIVIQWRTAWSTCTWGLRSPGCIKIRIF